MGQGSRLIRPRTVTGDGGGLVSHAGIAWLAEAADLSGLTAGLSTAMASVPQRCHDAGRTRRRWGFPCLSGWGETPAVPDHLTRRGETGPREP